MKKRLLGVHPDVLLLGAVSFLTDVSSEAIFSVFSIFFTTVAGASAAVLGLVEGFADFSASSLDYLSGWLSDKSGRRKPLAILGYGFSTLAKVFLLAANSVATLALFRVIERLGKSFRGPPRDAWLATVADEGNRGYSFGVHKALDKAGAVLGPLAAFAILNALGQTLSAFRLLFIGAVIAAAGAVVMLAFLRDAPGPRRERENIFKSWKVLSSGFRAYLIPAGIFSLAYFSFGFLLLRAYAAGFAITDVVLLYALFNMAFVITSPFVGKLGDRFGRKYIIGLEYVIYALMALGFVFAAAKWQIIALFISFGIFYAIDEGQSKAFIADIEKERRATAIGLYNFVTGLVYLPASAIAGFFWTMNPAYAFYFALIVTLCALVVFMALSRKMTAEIARPN